MNNFTKETMDEIVAKLEQAEQMRKAKRKKIEHLTMSLLAFDNECLGAAVRSYISGNADSTQLSDATLRGSGESVSRFFLERAHNHYYHDR